MHSSISSSEERISAAHELGTGTKASAALLVLAVLFLAAVELWTRQVAVWTSRIEQREEREYREAVAMRPAAGRRSLLVMGNSLLNLGVEFETLQSGLAPEWDARRLVVEDTGYLDWYYGMRRLAAQGARYDVLAVCLTPRQLLSTGVRGEYFAYRLMQPRDIFGVARDAGLDRTTASSMFFASISAFYGLRSEIRKVLIGRLMPDLPALMSLITARRGSPLSNEEIYRRAVPRLQAYRVVAAAQNAVFVVIVPPTQEAEGSAALVQAAADAGVPVVTVPRDLTGPADFSDGFHLNTTGAKKYTAALIPEISKVLGSATRPQSSLASNSTVIRPRR